MVILSPDLCQNQAGTQSLLDRQHRTDARTLWRFFFLLWEGGSDGQQVRQNPCSWSNLWFAPQSHSDLGPDWEGQMTHDSMISLYDYKEKCTLVPRAQESALSNSADKVLFKWVSALQVLHFLLKMQGMTWPQICIKLLFYQCPAYLKHAQKFRKWAQPFMPVAKPNWKEVKEWQPILCGTTWNILRASPHMLDSFYPQPEFLSQMKTLWGHNQPLVT